MVPRLAGGRPGVRRPLHRPRPRLRHHRRGAAADLAALPRVHPSGRHDRRGVDDLRRRPGRRQRLGAGGAAGADGRAAGLRGRGASAIRLDAIGFLWKERDHLPAPAADARGDQDLARPRRRPRTGRPAGHRDQRPARRERVLLRLRRGRGAPGVPVRPAAAGPALVRLGEHPRAHGLGAGHRSDQQHGDVVQLPRQPRRHRHAGDRGDPRRRPATGDGRAGPRPRRARVDGSAARRVAGRLRAQPQLPRRPVHPRARWRTPRWSRPRHSRRTPSCCRSSASLRSTTTRSSGRDPTGRAWTATGINRRINREVLDADALVSELTDDPAAGGCSPVWSTSCACDASSPH